MRRCYIEAWGIYQIIRDFNDDGKTFRGGETTTRMQFLGYADKDLRCVRFRHCWDHTPTFAQVNLKKYDGITEENSDYDVVTFDEEQIKRALMEATDTDYYVKYGRPMTVELKGNGKTKVSAWLYYPSEEGQDFSALRPRIEETYGIRFPQALADWYSEGVPFSIENAWLFPEWLNLSLSNVAKIKELIAKPKEWILSHVEKGMWHPSWGERPDHPDEAVEKVRTLFNDMPPIIPVCSYRYMLCLEGNEDPPIISIAGHDTVFYGNTLQDYLEVEFGGSTLPDEAAVPLDVEFGDN